ncbi:unnamed protein product [Lymnaea stagnalis]|uniref:Uncharacterized protein n=1 Tax=Lymnaea stagnalis TaxID=6523 RepID=A0AAV2H5L0_LYMST
MLQATGKAIDKSYRFVVIASKSYMENDLKVMEFDYIQQAIYGQESKLKDRLIIIQIQPCDIIGVYRVPCIEIPELAQQIDTMDQTMLQRFLTWEFCTRPPNIARSPRDHYRNLKETVTVTAQLIVPIFIVLSVLLVIVLSLRI